MTEPINPECREGKHRNCNTLVLDTITDEIARCLCECHIDDTTEYQEEP